MEYRVRLERVVMYFTRRATTYTCVAVGIVFVAVIAVTSVIAGTIFAPTLTIYCITTRAIIVVSFLTTLAIERVIFPTTLTPHTILDCMPRIVLGGRPFATLTHTIAPVAYSVATIGSQHVIFVHIHATFVAWYSLGLGYF
jgi:hypothetical protein